MKFDWNKKYTTIAIYTIIVFCTCYGIYKFTIDWEQTRLTFVSFFNILSPFLIALAISYFISPLINWLESTFLSNVKKHNVKRGFSILISYFLIFGFIVIILNFVIPQVISSFTELGKVPQNIINFINDISTKDKLQVFNTGYFLDLTILRTYFNAEKLEATLSSLSTNLEGSIPSILTYLQSLTSKLINVLLGIIIAIYILYNKETGQVAAKKVIIALLPTKYSSRFLNFLSESNKIFIGFVIGKLLDSLIIGILCFIGCNIFHFPFAVLISVLIGITNIIPYFGPFIGGAIGLVIILAINPIQGLWFFIFVLALQQFDGNILGPKILGDSTGLSPFWVMFAIIIFGKFFGAFGMFFGVPLIAVIRNVLTHHLSKLYKLKTHQ